MSVLVASTSVHTILRLEFYITKPSSASISVLHPIAVFGNRPTQASGRFWLRRYGNSPTVNEH